MWSYHGSKTNIVHLYPPPVHGHIIEPFAGTAKYALRYWQRRVTIIDRYPELIAVWKWLQRIDVAELLRLPGFVVPGQTIKDFSFETPEAQLLFGFLLSKGNVRPRNVVSNWVARERPNFINYSLQRMARDLPKIKHWEILLGDYRDACTDYPATWFIDPPYQVQGSSYVYNNSKIDFLELGAWVKSLPGQVIVCEGEGANWLPFERLTYLRGTTSGNEYNELIYYQKDQKKAPFLPKQLKLF